MIARAIEGELRNQLVEFPVVTVLGPSQAGKTTLVRATLPDYNYVTLEDPETLTIAMEDPKALLAKYRHQVIFDGIQRVPHLLSYLQGIADEKNVNGQFVLMGSHQLDASRGGFPISSRTDGYASLIAFVH